VANGIVSGAFISLFAGWFEAGPHLKKYAIRLAFHSL
jgi:hypothetical protein